MEFVHQEDNAFGTPDFVEETKASCRSINPDSEKSAELGGKIVLNNSDFKVLVKKVECQDNDNQEIPPYTKSNVHKLKLNGPFQIRSKNNELERAKILNAILKDVRNFKANKQCGSAIKGCRAKANQILLEEFLKAKSANENGEGPGKEVEPKMEEDDKLKTDKGGESKSQDDKNLMPAVLPFANEYFPRMKNIGKTVGCSTENPCKNIIRLEPFDDSKETKEPCTERPNVVCKEPDNQNPNNELMRKATYVKNKALQMLQLFNMSCLEDNQTKPDISNNCFQVLDGVFEAPTQSSKCPEEFLQNRDDDKNEKVPRKYKAYPGIPESFSRNSLLKLIKNKLASKNNLQRSFYKEYAVFNMIPRNNFNERMKNEQKQRLKSKRKARPTRANNYVLLMGKLPDRGGGNRKTPVKKSYKEFNFSTRNPVVYNSVVISSGDKVEKTDDNRDNFTRRRSLNYERNLNAYGSGRVRSRTSRRVREDNFKNAFSKSVRRKQININNIVQYFGLAKTFVKTVYLRPFLGQRSYLGGEGGGVKTAKLELNVTHIRPHYCLSNIL